MTVSLRQPGFKSLAVGNPVLAKILTVNRYEAVLALPNGSRGYVNFHDEGGIPSGLRLCHSLFISEQLLNNRCLESFWELSRSWTAQCALLEDHLFAWFKFLF